MTELNLLCDAHPPHCTKWVRIPVTGWVRARIAPGSATGLVPRFEKSLNAGTPWVTGSFSCSPALSFLIGFSGRFVFLKRGCSDCRKKPDFEVLVSEGSNSSFATRTLPEYHRIITLKEKATFQLCITKKGASKSPPPPPPKPDPNYPSTTGKPSGKGRWNTPKN